MDDIKQFINLVVNEDLAKAQDLIKTTLNEKLGKALSDKFNDYAPSIFEELDPVGKEDGDVDNDGDEDSTDEYLLNRRKAIGAAMGEGEEEEEEEEESEEEEEEEEEEKDEE